MWSLTPVEMNYTTHNAHAQKVPALHCKNAINRLKYFTYNTYLLTYSTEQSPSWEPNQFSTSQEFFRFLWNPKFHYRVYNSPPPVPIPSHINPIHDPSFQLPEDPS